MTNKDFLSTDTCNNHLIRVMRGNSEVLDEVHEASSSLLWLIFMNYMAYILQNYHLELALHLSNSQFFVHSVTSCKQQLLWNSNVKECLC